LEKSIFVSINQSTMTTNPNLNVYLQALGGKFLGPNAYDTNNITITLNYSGGEIKLPYNLDNNPDDGQINTTFTSDLTSCLPILTAQQTGNPVVNYLTPLDTTIVAKAGITIKDKYETGTLVVTIPTPDGKPLVFSETVVLSSLQLNDRFIIPIPGLLLTGGQNSPKSTTISVFVKMMCGCGITKGLPNSFWSPLDFTVQAEVIDSKGTTKNVPLAFDTVTNDSLFFATVPDTENVQQVNFTARQISTGNFGYFSWKV
jgi:hypothetical protein